MLIRKQPTSNADRQRAFRARNPGYFKRYNRKYASPTPEEFAAELAAIAGAQAAATMPSNQSPAVWFASA